MRDTGGSIRLADMASSGTLMVTFSKENGLTTRPMDTEFTSIRTEPDTRVNGEMISSTDKEKRSGQIIQCTRATITKERSTVRDYTSGKMAPDTTETGLKTESKDSENTNGKMAGATQVSGKTIICTEKEFTLGPTAEDTKVNTKWTKSTGTECISGLMAESMRATGLTENSMARANTCFKMVLAS